MVYYCFKGISPLKVSISKLIFDVEEKNNFEINSIKINKRINPYSFQVKSTKGDISKKSVKSSKSKKKKQNKSKKVVFPPKKIVARKARKNSFDEKKDQNQIKLIDLAKKKRHSIKNVNKKEDNTSVKSDKVRKRKSIIDYQAEKELVLNTKEELLNQEALDSKNNKAKELSSKQKLKPNQKMDNKSYLKTDKSNNLNPDLLDDYELNNMGYFDASDLDKRSCIRTYWSFLKREHYVIFTFIAKNDFNLFYVKIERFFILICTEMTMNGMFFVHETMYKKKTGDTSFAQKIPQLIFSLLVSHAVEIILCYLSMTDKHYYEIKALPKIKKNDERIIDILKCIKWKLIGFFIFTFLVFLFHWYFISAFCAVYQNTQIIFLRDSAISILMSLIDPFIIYGITCLLRAISLSLCCRKKLWCIYKLSDLIPFF